MANPAAEENAKLPRQFVNFVFYKVDNAWLGVDRAVREAGVAEFAEVVADYRKSMLIYPYTTLGVRADTDFLLWRISYDLDAFESMSAAIRRTSIAPYLQTATSMLAMTKTSIYVDDHVHEGQESVRNRIVIGGGKYLFVYPFVKSRQWYMLPMEERQRIMRGHIRFGHEFPSVKLNTTYSFGLDDQDFVVAFETDHPDHFLDLVQGLRETEASLYTVRDTPLFTCTQMDLPTILAHVSGL
ncbi:MAG: chlorite dismutase family protein [Capsulimonadaceae bacterium]